jgi:Tfp pilus assembly protein PilP
VFKIKIRHHQRSAQSDPFHPRAKSSATPNHKTRSTHPPNNHKKNLQTVRLQAFKIEGIITITS